MKKNEMIAAIAGKVDGVSQDKIGKVLDAFFEELTNLLVTAPENEALFNVKNFATIKRVSRAARTARSPVTKEMITIPPCMSLKLVLSDSLKAKLNS